jgi:O-antigen/teichoic acid export membrane protein
MLIRGTFLSGGSVFISTLAILLVRKMATNALAQDIVGIYFLLILSSEFLNLCNNFGLSVALPKLVGAAGEQRQEEVIRANLSGQLVVSAGLGMALLLLWCIIPDPLAAYPEVQWLRVYPYLWLVPPLFLVGTLRDNILAILAGLNRYATRATGIILASLVQLVLVFVLVWLWRYELEFLVWSMWAGYAVAFALMYGLLPFGRRPGWDWKTFKEGLSFSLPLYLKSLLNFFFQRFDSFLVVWILGLSSAAIFEVAKSFPKLLSRSLGALQVPFLPNISELIARGEHDTASRLLNQALVLATFFGYVAVLGVVLFQEWLILLLSNADYLEAATVIGLLMAGICLAVQAGFMELTLIALERPALVTVANFVMALVSIIANCLLLPLYGLVGGGVALLLGALCNVLLQSFFVTRHGIVINRWAYAKPQLIMLFCCAVIFVGGGALFWRGVALGLFVVLSFATGVVTILHVQTLVNSLLPIKRDQSK